MRIDSGGARLRRLLRAEGVGPRRLRGVGRDRTRTQRILLGRRSSTCGAVSAATLAMSSDAVVDLGWPVRARLGLSELEFASDPWLQHPAADERPNPSTAPTGGCSVKKIDLIVVVSTRNVWRVSGRRPSGTRRCTTSAIHAAHPGRARVPPVALQQVPEPKRPRTGSTSTSSRPTFERKPPGWNNSGFAAWNTADGAKRWTPPSSTDRHGRPRGQRVLRLRRRNSPSVASGPQTSRVMRRTAGQADGPGGAVSGLRWRRDGR